MSGSRQPGRALEGWTKDLAGVLWLAEEERLLLGGRPLAAWLALRMGRGSESRVGWRD